MEKMTYEIGGKTYIQRPLVLGQWRQLIPLMAEISFPEDPGVQDIVAALQNGIERIAAVILTEEGAAIREKDLDALAEEFEFSLTPEIILQVADDFFVCNPLLSILAWLKEAAERIEGSIETTLTRDGSTSSASFSPAETSPGATPSSGDTI